VLGEVQKYMIAHGHAGPFVVRYDKGPVGGISRPPRAAVGFVADEGYIPESPFQIVRKEAEFVAHMVIEGRPGPTQRDYIRIREWALARGYEPTGQITELYAITAREQSGGSMRTEIQVAVVPRVPPPPEVMAMREEKHPAWADRQPEQELATDATSPPWTQPMPSPQVSRLVQSTFEPPASEPLRPIRELIAAERFDRLAQQLMPDNRSLPPLDQLWLGQLVFRIGAVARGIEQVHPGQERKVAELAEALKGRYKRVYAELRRAPLDEVIVRVGNDDAALGVRKRGIMSDVDRLLSRIALRTIDADSALDDVADMLERTQELLQQISPTTKQVNIQ
jgi:effector-binding domain-containing protein